MPTLGASNPNYMECSDLWTSQPSQVEPIQAFEQTCASGDLEAVRRLVNGHHPHPNYLQFGILEAISQKQLHVTRYLLDQGARIDRLVAHRVLYTKSLPFFELLVDQGWDVNAPVTHTMPALRYLVDDESLVRWFLNRGADPNLGPPVIVGQGPPWPETRTGNALNSAAARSTVSVFDLLLERGAKLEDSLPLHFAAIVEATDERIRMMAHLVDLGVDVNGSDDSLGPYWFGRPIHWAIRDYSLEAVRLLFEKGADPLIKNRYGATALEQAVEYGCPEIIEFLKASVAT